MVSIDELTIDQLHASLKAGEYTSRQLVEAYIQRIEALDQKGPKLNAITVVSHLAVDEADALDTFFEENGSFKGPLHGVPVIVKDQCDTKGVQTCYGNVCCKHIPTEDSTLVRKLREAGAIILAKSTMPDFAASYNSVSSVSGETRNPYNTNHESGGSSAGTGTAIAANYGLIGVGEDTGGSIRVPASFCNLVGLRPTVGLVSRAGLSPLIKTNDTPGPMTRTVRDAALMLDALVGYDPKDLYTANQGTMTPPKGGSYASNLTEATLASAKLGVLDEVFGDGSSPEHEAVNKVIRDALSKFTTGSQLIDVTIPKLSHFLSFTTTYMSRSRWDINNFLASHPHIKGVTFESIHSSKQFHPALALYQKLGEGISHPRDDPEYGERLDQQQEFQRTVISVMIENNLDAMVYPSVKITPPTIEDTLNTRFWDYFPTNTGIGSQLRFPAISVPVGFTEGGLPVGLEILGVPYSEQKLLELAYGVESLLKARRAPNFVDI